jgi:hypothetical protein
MIVVDANLLIYAYNEDGAHFDGARQWLQDVLSSGVTVGIPWTVVLAFLRLTTAGRVITRPITIQNALAVVDSWASLPNVRLLSPGPQHLDVLREILTSANARGPLVSDAHIAALTIEHDATLYSADRDFARFRGLRFVNPLA